MTAQASTPTGVLTRPSFVPARQEHLVGYVRQPLARRCDRYRALAPAVVAVPVGLVDAEQAAALTGVPATALLVLARRNPDRVPAARIVDGAVFFDPTQLSAVTR